MERLDCAAIVAALRAATRAVDFCQWWWYTRVSFGISVQDILLYDSRSCSS